MKELNLTASRRLMLSAETSGVTAFVLHSGTAAHPSAAHTRWRVKAAPSMALPGYAPGKPVFNVELLRQRAGKGNAVFITIEDETGIVNALLWASEFEKQRRPVMASRLMVIEGEVQRSKENVVHLMASRVIDATAALQQLSEGRPATPGPVRVDGDAHPPRHGHPRNVRILPRSRDFH